MTAPDEDERTKGMKRKRKKTTMNSGWAWLSTTRTMGGVNEGVKAPSLLPRVCEYSSALRV